VIHSAVARAHVTGVRDDGALVVIEELGAFLTFHGVHRVTLLSRPEPQDAERAAVRRLRTRENRLDGVRDHGGIHRAAA
jgi:hypothetical protein